MSLSTDDGNIVFETKRHGDSFEKSTTLDFLFTDTKLYSNVKYYFFLATFDHVFYKWEIIFSKDKNTVIEIIDNTFRIDVRWDL